MNDDNNRKELIEAFERLKGGKPIRTEVGRKITPTSVEDEAGLGRSILRNNEDYKDIFDAVVYEKLVRAKRKVSDNKKNISSIDKQNQELNEALRRSNERNKNLQKKCDALLARNAELTQIIVSKRYNEAFFKSLSNEMTTLVFGK